MKKELARTITVALSQFIDNNREGGMCMSSGECEAMEKAFIADDFGKIGDFVNKKLAESEDERIRKAIVEHFEAFSPIKVFGKRGTFTRDQVLAYLEKQKDTNCLACDQHLKGYLAGRKATEEEKQKEQKPVETSDFKTKLAEYMMKNRTGYSYNISSESILEMAKEELIKRGELQKPAWSEEDENALKYIHELISWGYAEKFMDAQTAHDMRKWVNEHMSRDTFQNGNSRWKPTEDEEPEYYQHFDPDC